MRDVDALNESMSRLRHQAVFQGVEVEVSTFSKTTILRCWQRQFFVVGTDNSSLSATANFRSRQRQFFVLDNANSSFSKTTLFRCRQRQFLRSRQRQLFVLDNGNFGCADGWLYVQGTHTHTHTCDVSGHNSGYMDGEPRDKETARRRRQRGAVWVAY